ncbi:hypothetical protein RhiirA4_480988 [Rhizophagus irregularis]|uniref:CCHC-type domain-containing protein n=1 Tax=Rhizophagus irregularis TaxID=588596 RepID=A0A2I1HIS5_9GLOM|nr:hypothetical protein RhiirA4_480988 [Rhizophagus irregularis]
MGHYAKECQVEIKIIKGKDNKCKNCSKKGHYIKGCLNGQSGENNDKININKNNENGNPDQKNMRKFKEYRKYYSCNISGYKGDHEEIYYYFMNKRPTELKKGIYQMLLEINLIKTNNEKY